MKTNLFSSANGLDEVVFENRNKMYGAYDLRKTYEERLTLSAMASVSFFMLLLSSFFIFQSKPEIPPILAQPVDGTCTLTPPPLFIETPQQMFQDPVATAKVTPDIVKHEVKSDDQPKPVKDPSPLQGNGDGTGQGVPGGTGTEPFTGIEKPQIVLPDPEPKITEFIDYFDKAPVFPGYESYLQNHIKYPEYAIVNNIQGVIYVMVKINAMGEVVNAEVIKGIGGGCDQEAIRVIKNMPAWQPGLQNGKPVPVKCVLRVKMLLQN